MDTILIYVLQVNLLMLVVYLGYVLLLKNLTFYQVNRGYFIVGVLFSFAYPFLDIKSLFARHIEPIGEIVYFLPELFVEEPVTKDVFTLNSLFIVLLGIGASIFLMKMLIQLFSLLRIHVRSEPAVWKTFVYRNVFFPIVPFSFFDNIYVNKQQHQEDELLNIFKHEDIHAKGWHTFDILLAEIVLITCWYNPVVWLMRKAVRQNLEFLTDQQVLDKGVDRQVYQYSLLNVSKQGLHASIANQFNFKMLKRRIMMMNKKRSSKLELSKYAFLIPVFVFTAGAFTVSKAGDKIEEVVQRTENISLDTLLPRSSNIMGETILEEQSGLEEDVAGITVFNESEDSKGIYLLLRDIQSNREEPLIYVIDGKMMPDYDINQLDPDEIERVEVHKGKLATTLSGREGDRVVLITTKERPGDILYVVDGQEQGPDFNRKSLKDLKNITGITIFKDASNSHIYPKGRMEITTEAVRDTIPQSQDNSERVYYGNGFTVRQIKPVDSLGNPIQPLIIVDGNPVTTEDLSAMSPDDIDNISVLKDQAATTNYGEKGKHGVLIITTKAAAEQAESSSSQMINRAEMIEGVTIIGYAPEDAPTHRVDVAPEPRGGMTEFRKWVGANYQYPEEAIKAGVRGTIMVSFVVEADGSLSDIKVTQDLGQGTGQAAVNLFKKSPKWAPGIVDGKGIRTQYSFPITLNLQR